jgi:hypothetical protein
MPTTSRPSPPGTLRKATLSIDRPKLTPADEQKLCEEM